MTWKNVPSFMKSSNSEEKHIEKRQMSYLDTAKVYSIFHDTNSGHYWFVSHLLVQVRNGCSKTLLVYSICPWLSLTGLAQPLPPPYHVLYILKSLQPVLLDSRRWHCCMKRGFEFKSLSMGFWNFRMFSGWEKRNQSPYLLVVYTSLIVLSYGYQRNSS